MINGMMVAWMDASIMHRYGTPKSTDQAKGNRDMRKVIISSKYGGVSEISTQQTGNDLTITIGTPGNVVSITLCAKGAGELLNRIRDYCDEQDVEYMRYLEAQEESMRCGLDIEWHELKGDPKY